MTEFIKPKKKAKLKHIKGELWKTFTFESRNRVLTFLNEEEFNDENDSNNNNNNNNIANNYKTVNDEDDLGEYL